MVQRVLYLTLHDPTSYRIHSTMQTPRGIRALVLVALLLFASESAHAKDPPHLKLFKAAQKGDSDGIRAALRKNPDVLNTKGESRGYTALHWASIRGHTDAVRTLLLAGADQEAKNARQSTPLVLAAWKGHFEVVRELLAACGHDGGLTGPCLHLDEPNEGGMTPLAWAAREGHADIASLLVAAGSDPTAEAATMTPITWASSRGYTAIALLLEAQSTGQSPPAALGDLKAARKEWAAALAAQDTATEL